MKPIQWRKLYSFNPMEGTFNFSIVTYAKRPHLMKTRYIESIPDESVIIDRQPDQYIAQYHKVLILDLWIVVLRFDWLSREITKEDAHASL